jgi:hypothetical protein
MRALAAILVMVISYTAHAHELSVEYRRDALDDEDVTKEFVRFGGTVSAGEKSGAFCAASWIPEEKRRDCTIAFVSAEDDSPCTVYAGDYYTRFGSGLLIGRGRPYNPDPFSVEKGIERMNVFRASTTGNPSSCFRGVALSGIISEEILSWNIFGSQAVRYYEGGDGAESSAGTLFTRSRAAGSYHEPLYLRSAGFMLGAHRDYYTSQLSVLYCDAVSPKEKRLLWESESAGSGYRSAGGGSIYAAYNDGMVKVFAEAALTESEYQNGGSRSKRHGYSAQGEFSVEGDCGRLCVAGKRIGENYYSPFSSPMGSKTPSEGVYFSANINPARWIRLGGDVSVEHQNKPTDFSPELKSKYKEGFSLQIKPLQWIAFSSAFRMSGESASSISDRKQTRYGITVGHENRSKIDMNYLRQQGGGKSAHAAECEGTLRIGKMLNCGIVYTEIWTKGDDTVYLSPLPLDDARISWMAVGNRAHSASAKCSLILGGITVRTRGLVLWYGKHLIMHRIECAAAGVW